MRRLVPGYAGRLVAQAAALMAYVARANRAGCVAQRGAILGFFIGGLLFLGGDIFSFNISW